MGLEEILPKYDKYWFYLEISFMCISNAQNQDLNIHVYVFNLHTQEMVNWACYLAF